MKENKKVYLVGTSETWSDGDGYPNTYEFPSAIYDSLEKAEEAFTILSEYGRGTPYLIEMSLNVVGRETIRGYFYWGDGLCDHDKELQKKQNNEN